MAASHAFGAFNASAEPWDNYELRFKAWLLMQDIGTAEKKRAALIAEVGPEAFATLKDLSFPADVNDKTFEELLTLLQEHYKRNRTPMADRLQLHNRKQHDNETLTDYIAGREFI